MYGVILAGGGGTRLWPASRQRLPKPLMPLLPDGSTMLQVTLARLRPLIPVERLFVCTGEAYVAECRRQLPDLPADNFIVEPSGRDTAAAVGLAACHVAHRDADAVMGIFPADHLVQDEPGFRASLALAETVAHQDFLVTIGMRARYPETGYGYIEAAEAVPGVADARARVVARFVEKPKREVAEGYVASGRHYWNAGVFVWHTGVILERFAVQLPDIYQGLAAIQQSLGTPAAGATLASVWPEMRRISIDFGIMEGAPRVATIVSDVGWSDAGDWNAVGLLLGSPGQGYASAGIERIVIESRDCVVSAPAGKLVATFGVDDLVIVDTPEALLVCPRSRAQEVRRVVDELKARGRTDML